MTPNTGVPGLDEDLNCRRSRALLVRNDVCHTAVRVETVHQDRWNRRHRLDRPIFNEIRGDHQKRIHLMIMECGQSPALVITIISRVHEDQQVISAGRGLQRRVQHARCEATGAGPGQYADGTAALVAQTERDCVRGVVKLASGLDDRLLLITCDISLPTTVQDQRDRAPGHAGKVGHILCSRLAYHLAAPLAHLL